jgi:hypothetical protein
MLNPRFDSLRLISSFIGRESKVLLLQGCFDTIDMLVINAKNEWTTINMPPTRLIPKYRLFWAINLAFLLRFKGSIKVT